MGLQNGGEGAVQRVAPSSDGRDTCSLPGSVPENAVGGALRGSLVRGTGSWRGTELAGTGRRAGPRNGCGGEKPKDLLG